MFITCILFKILDVIICSIELVFGVGELITWSIVACVAKDTTISEEVIRGALIIKIE